MTREGKCRRCGWTLKSNRKRYCDVCRTRMNEKTKSWGSVVKLDETVLLEKKDEVEL